MNLQQKVAAGQFVITAEVTPPVTFVNITDGAGARPHMSALISATLLAQNGMEPILQLTCRDRNRIALQSELMGAAAVGIRNILALRGDDPTAGDQPETKPVFDLDSRGLLETARRMRDQGELPNGKPISGRAEFFLGTADSPIDPPAGWEPKGLAGKVASGAQFAQTQFCMDAGVARRYIARLAEHGLDKKLPLLIGIAPLRSAKSARWMKEKLFGTIMPDAVIDRMEKAADPVAEGIRVAVDLIAEISQIPNIGGVHIMAPNNDEALPIVIGEARKRLTQKTMA
jgi:methylenetetrahydrofolate reductase (NADPH)